MSRRSMRVPNISASAAYPARRRWPISSTIAQSSNGSLIAAVSGLAESVAHLRPDPVRRGVDVAVRRLEPPGEMIGDVLHLGAGGLISGAQPPDQVVDVLR